MFIVEGGPAFDALNPQNIPGKICICNSDTEEAEIEGSPGDCWSISLADLASSRPVREPNSQ